MINLKILSALLSIGVFSLTFAETKSQTNSVEKTTGKSTESKVVESQKNIEKTMKENHDELIAEGNKSMQKGIDFLLQKQMGDGSWLHHPAITSLAILSLANSTDAKNVRNNESIENAMKFVLKYVQQDGSIWEKSSRDYPSYSTAVCLVTFGFLNKPEYKEIIKNAREFLKSTQITDVSPEENPNYGGFGYGNKSRADLSNTQYVLEALYLTENIDQENPDVMKKNSEMWQRAQIFLSRCQNLAETNDQAWVVNDPKNNGSFVYLPENKELKAGETDAKGNKATLRGYGSMTYAGLKSMIYAKMDKNDVRIKSAYNWAVQNYTLTENPGMGLQGLYYYFNTFSKAMALMESDEIKLTDGKTKNWKSDLIKKLIEIQQKNGSWVNSEGRWFESMPELVTAYSLISLQEALGNDVQKIMRK